MDNYKIENQLLTKQEKKKEFKLWSILLMVVLFFSAAGLVLYSLQLHQKNDAMKEEAIVDKQELRDKFNLTFGELEQNLAAVTAHQNAIRSSMLKDNPKGPRSVEERVQQEVLIIEALLNQNRLITADLSAQLGESNEDLADYAKKKKSLQQKLNVFVTKIQELEALNIQLSKDLNQSEADKAIFEKDLLAQVAHNDELSENILAKDNKIFKLEKTVNTSYYVVGEYMELRDLDVVEWEGRIIGIGGAKTLKDDFDTGQFIEIDRANYTTIPVFSKRAKLATNHPSDSYKWVESANGIQWLEITKPVKFWMNSKCLVVFTEKETSFEKAA